MKNVNHDLIQQTSEMLDGIWRMEDYMKNAREAGCEQCTNLWKDLKSSLEGGVKKLRDEIENHVRGSMFD